MEIDKAKPIVKFDGKDFTMWKQKVQNLLSYHNLDSWSKAKSDSTKKEEVAAEKKALAVVKNTLADNLFRKYCDYTNLVDLWKALEDEYEAMDAQMLFVLRNKFLFSKKGKQEPMRDYLNNLTNLSHELKAAGLTINDSDFILTMMNGTHHEFGDYVSSICGKQKIDQLKIIDF